MPQDFNTTSNINLEEIFKWDFLPPQRGQFRAPFINEKDARQVVIQYRLHNYGINLRGAIEDGVEYPRQRREALKELKESLKPFIKDNSEITSLPDGTGIMFNIADVKPDYLDKLEMLNLMTLLLEEELNVFDEARDNLIKLCNEIALKVHNSEVKAEVKKAAQEFVSQNKYEKIEHKENGVYYKIPLLDKQHPFAPIFCLYFDVRDGEMSLAPGSNGGFINDGSEVMATVVNYVASRMKDDEELKSVFFIDGREKKKEEGVFPYFYLTKALIKQISQKYQERESFGFGELEEEVEEVELELEDGNEIVGFSDMEEEDNRSVEESELPSARVFAKELPKKENPPAQKVKKRSNLDSFFSCFKRGGNYREE